MSARSCEIYEQPKYTGDVLSESPVRRLMAISDEIQTELAKIKKCAGPCEDGMVQISPPSGAPRQVRCPIASPHCAYGISLKDKLDKWLNRLMREAGVPPRHIDNFQAYFHTPALICAEKWDFRGFLVLSGGSGAGKSFAAAWAVKKYLQRAISDPLDASAWGRAANACENRIWGSANGIAQNKDMGLRTWSKYPLVIDDFGREGDSRIRRTDLSEFISARYDAKAPTIITTELTFNDILGLYGRYTAYKLTEDRSAEGSPSGGGGMFANCGDVSLRNEGEEEFSSGSGFDARNGEERG
jgi:hypothetical protein